MHYELILVIPVCPAAHQDQCGCFRLDRREMRGCGASSWTQPDGLKGGRELLGLLPAGEPRPRTGGCPWLWSQRNPKYQSLLEQLCALPGRGYLTLPTIARYVDGAPVSSSQAGRSSRAPVQPPCSPGRLKRHISIFALSDRLWVLDHARCEPHHAERAGQDASRVNQLWCGGAVVCRHAASCRLAAPRPGRPFGLPRPRSAQLAPSCGAHSRTAVTIPERRARRVGPSRPIGGGQVAW